MKKRIITAAVLSLLLVSCTLGCGENAENDNATRTETDAENNNETSMEDNIESYEMITMDDAKEIFEEAGDYIILDVRTKEEFDQGHIPGAINIANEDITDQEIEELSDKDQTIYVYCRSGNRSKQAAEKLVELGYSNVIEFGGIIDWTGDIEK